MRNLCDFFMLCINLNQCQYKVEDYGNDGDRR